MQLTPNDEIFITVPNGSARYLHVINQPNVRGLGCNVQQHHIRLPKFHDFALPNLPYFRSGPVENSTCDTLGPICQYTYESDIWNYTFTDISTNDPTTWLWDFGDGDTSNEQDPDHTFTATGMYQVCLTTSNQYGEDTYCETIHIIDTGLPETELAGKIKLVPNPTQSEVHFTFPDDFVLEQLNVFDASGRLFKKSKGLISSINLSAFPAGVYLLEFVDGAGRRVMKRVVRL